MLQELTRPLASGRVALDAGQWETAKEERFQAVLDHRDDGEACHCLGVPDEFKNQQTTA